MMNTVLYPRSMSTRIVPNQDITLVGQIINLNEQTKTLIL